MEKNVVSLKKTENLNCTLKKLSEKRISGAPVVDEDMQVIGVISLTDILKAVEGIDKRPFLVPFLRLLEDKQDFEKLIGNLKTKQVKDIMSSPAITIEEDRPLEDAANIMATKDINRVPVTDKNKRLTGIITRKDLLEEFPRATKTHK